MSTSFRQLLYGGVQTVVATANDPSQLWPANDVETVGARRIDFHFYLSSISGSPSAAKLQAKFQRCHSSAGGTEWTTPVWQDFDDHDVANRLLGGAAWGYQDVANGLYNFPRSIDHTPGTLHDSSISGGGLTLGYGVTCAVVQPYEKMRVVLLPTFTGGTSPSYQIQGYWEVSY